MQVNPKGSGKEWRRVHRGESWYGSLRYCRVSFRSGDSSKFSHYSLGFRVAMGVSHASKF